MTIQLVGVLTLAYFLSRIMFFKKINLVTILDGLIFTSVSLLLIFQTGGLRSPLFYLLYVLLFGLSLIFGPLITSALALLFAVIFFQQVINLNDLLQILGLVIITPIAIYFGHEYLEVQQDKERIKTINRKKTALEKESGKEEENVFLWLNLTFRNRAEEILDSTSNLLADISKLTPFQKENLEKIHRNTKELLKTGERLKEYFEK